MEKNISEFYSKGELLENFSLAELVKINRHEPYHW